MTGTINIATRLALLFAVAFFLVGNVQAQTSGNANKRSTNQTSNLVEATNQLKSSSAALLTLQEAEIATAEAKLTELRSLVAEGLVAKVELETEEQKVTALKAKREATQKQVTDSDDLLAEVKAEQEAAKIQATKPTVKLVSKSYGSLNPTATIIRGDNGAAWSLGNIISIELFFTSQFGHSLPISAMGQSATHNRLGYDHRNAVDVALNPDSAEGKSLINYLQSQGIPFLAFRGAVPGVATGPHIHIGRPSHRI